MTIQGIIYDKDGNKITTGKQTTVGGESGIFYMSFQIKASNRGNVRLSSLRLQESHPSSLTNALQGEPASQPILDIGEQNIIEWNTANSCTSDAMCGSSEKCVNDLCLIDISNFLGDITFGATLNADYLDAQGQNLQVASYLMNLPLTFQQDEVIFRTTSLSASEFGNSGIQVVIDRESDGSLEAYTYNTAGTEGYSPSDFIGWTVQNNLIYKCGTISNICISQSTSLDKQSSYASLSRWKYNAGGSLTTTKNPTEPYLSSNCGGIKPCQERYSLAVDPQEETCYDSAMNQDETDIDCGGTICSACELGKTCLENSDCISDNCTENLCVEGSGTGGGDVNFRTTDLSYGSGGVAYSSICGNTLLTYGYETGMSHSAYECENHASFSGGTVCSGANCLLLTGLPNAGSLGIADSLSTTDYRLYQDDSDPEEIWVCVNDVDGDGCWTSRFDRDKGAISGVSDSPESTNPTREVSC